MPPDSLGSPFTGVIPQPVHLHEDHRLFSSRYQGIANPKAASTNTEFNTSATCHIDHASLTGSLPCNSGGPVIQDPDLHAHVQREQHEDRPQNPRPVRAQLVAGRSRLDSHYNYSVGTKSAATTTSSMDAIIASQRHHESKFCATPTTSYLTSSCSSTSTSSEIDDPTRKPLPDCEIEQISPPNEWFASSRNSKGEVGVTPKEPPIPSYATSHPQFDYAMSRGWSIDMFIYCHDWHEPQEPTTGPLNVPQCMREPGLAPRSDGQSALKTGGHHLTKVFKLLTNG